MVTGSLASTFHGEPRATRDIDIVIDPTPEALDRLLQGLDADGFHVDAQVAGDALRARSSFNAIGDATTKVDFIVRRDRPFSRSEFERRLPADLLGAPGYVASVEDMIVAKLEWATAGGSDRQTHDVAGMLAVAGEAVDREYIEHWVRELRLEDAWSRVAGS